MLSNGSHDAHDYAERIRERLLRRLQELREASGRSKYALWQKAGVSRNMIGCIEAGTSIPTLHVSARLGYVVDKTLTAFVEQLEDVLGKIVRADDSRKYSGK